MSQKLDSKNDSETNTTTVEDLTYAIKENLENDKSLPTNILSQLNNLENLEGLFISLSKKLNFQEVTDFGKNLISNNINDDSAVTFYIKYMLLEKVK